MGQTIKPQYHIHSRGSCWIAEQLHPLVGRMRADAQSTGHLPNRIAPHRDLMHRIALELVTVIARPHVGLLASKLGGKASTNLAAPHSPFFLCRRWQNMPSDLVNTFEPAFPRWLATINSPAGHRFLRSRQYTPRVLRRYARSRYRSCRGSHP